MTRPPVRPQHGGGRLGRWAAVVTTVITAVITTGVLLAPAASASEHGVVTRATGETSAGTGRTTSGVGGAVDTASPLRVSMRTLAPGTIPRKGRLVVTGRITNRSQDTWTDLNAYLTTSGEPITSRSALAEADATPADTPVAERRAEQGLYDEVGDLGPGQSIAYRLSVRRADLGISGAPGVYWVGVHVLGALDGARDTVADGRARTFVPLLPAPGTAVGRAARTRLSLVLPVVEPVHRGRTARLVDPGGWERALAEGGRLTRLLGLSAGGGSGLSWLVDPAVLDAVGSVAAGNPPLDTGPTDGGAGDGGGSGDPSASPSASENPSDGSSAGASTSASAGPSGSGDDGAGTGADGTTSAAAADARSWLTGFRRQSAAHRVLALPYGDLDVAAVLQGPVSTLYARATGLSRAALADHGVQDASPVVSPSTGYLPSDVVSRLPPGTTALLADAAAPGIDGPVLGAGDDSPVVLADTRAGSGGPRPGSAWSALAVRQRLLSDAALHAMGPDRDQPLVVRMPDDWDPGRYWPQADFFGALTQPWLQLVDLPTVVAAARPGPGSTGSSTGGTGSTDSTGSSGGATVDDLTYPTEEAAAEVPVANQLSARELVRTGGQFARLLTNNDTVDEQLSRVAVLGVSAAARSDPDAARLLTTATTAYVRSQLGRVHVVGLGFVMMSGESGPIQVTLVNDLPQTVTVGLRATTPGSDMTIGAFRPVTLGPGRRTSTRLEASSTDIGVHSVTLRVTDAAGVPLGSETTFNVRTSHVSTVIWVIMGAGAALLFLTIAVRLVRRVRRRRATHGPLLPRTDGLARDPEPVA